MNSLEVVEEGVHSPVPPGRYPDAAWRRQVLLKLILGVNEVAEGNVKDLGGIDRAR